MVPDGAGYERAVIACVVVQIGPPDRIDVRFYVEISERSWPRGSAHHIDRSCRLEACGRLKERESRTRRRSSLSTRAPAPFASPCRRGRAEIEHAPYGRLRRCTHSGRGNHVLAVSNFGAPPLPGVA